MPRTGVRGGIRETVRIDRAFGGDDTTHFAERGMTYCGLPAIRTDPEQDQDEKPTCRFCLSIAEEPRPTAFTEAQLLAALRKRFTYPGNGGSGRYAFLTHVRTGAAWDQQEIDAVVMGLWPSDHLDLHAFEVKCSRSDWLREIKPDTSKSEAARRLCDYFSVVAPVGVVLPGDLPVGWGHLVAFHDKHGEIRLKVQTPATRTTPEEPPYLRQMPRGFVVAMLRAAGAVPGMRTGLKRKPASESADSRTEER